MMNELFERLVAALDESRQSGQGLVEYALILAFVSILSIAALGALSTGINGVFAAVTAAL